MAEKIVVQQGSDVDPHATKLYVPNDSGEGWTTHEIPHVPDAAMEGVENGDGAETPEVNGEAEVRADVHEKVLEHVVEDSERRSEEVAELQKTVAELRAQVEELQKRLDGGRTNASVEREGEPQEASDAKELADVQPRRVRNLDPSNPNSPTEKLVKYADGTFEWVSTGTRPSVPEGEKSESGDKTEVAEDAPSTEAQPNTPSENQPEAPAVPQSETPATDSTPEQKEKTPDASTGNDTESVNPETAENTHAENSEPAASEPGKEIEPVQATGKELEKREPGKELEPYRGVEIPPELANLLQESIDRYAEETAKSRNGYLGQFMRTSKFLVKIPVVGKLMTSIAEKVNEHADRDLNEARRKYELTLREAQKVIFQEMRTRNAQNPGEMTPEQFEKAVQYNMSVYASESDKAFEERVVSERMATSKPTNRIVNWWASHNGIGGKLAKFAGVATAGAAVSGLVTTLGVIGGVTIPGIGAVAGMAAGAAIGNYVTKRRANAVDSDGVTLAERQSREDRAAKQERVSEALSQATRVKNPDYDPNNPASGPEYIVNQDAFMMPEDLTQVTEARTAEEMRGNRRRWAAAKAAGGLGGGLGEVFARAATGQFDAVTKAASGPEQNFDSPSNPANNMDGAATPDAGVGESVPTPEQFNGLNFDIESGNGYTNELMQFAQANGHELSPQQAWDLHQNLVGKFGGDYIDIVNRAQDVYQSAGGDFRLSAPGQAAWDPGVAEAIKEWMTGQGLW